MFRAGPALALVSALGSVLAAAVTLPARADAQPMSDADKGDAKALLASGLKLFAAKDYLGALSVFETAYERYPSAKILLNIGTTLIRLGRKAEAANVYQRYIDAKDVDPAKQVEAKKTLANLDKELGVLTFAIEPETAEIQIAGGKWVPAENVRKQRVTPGDITVLARAPRYKLRAEPFQIAASETRTVEIQLVAEPVEVAAPTGNPGGGLASGAGELRKGAPLDERSRIAALVMWHVDPINKGSAVLVGLSADVMPMINVQATALLGPQSGAYAGASFAVLRGRVRPLISAGLPIVFSDGARLAARGAVGVELAINRHFALVAEAGVERFLNPEDDVENATVFVPSIGATGRL